MGARGWPAAAALAAWIVCGPCLAQQHGIEPGSPELADSLDPATSPPMVSLYPKWTMEEATRIGRRSRPVAVSQNAWPACFATAAGQAADMSKCKDKPRKGEIGCAGMPDSARVSSLWLSKVGADTSGAAPSGLVMTNEGGSAFGALRFALGTGAAPSAQACPWPKSDPKGEEVGNQRMEEEWIAQARMAKQKQRELVAAGADPQSYLSKYWKARWTKAMSKGFPDLGEKAAAAMDTPDASAAIGASLWSPGCDKPTLPMPKASAASMPSKPTWQENIEALKALLSSGREPIISVCLDVPVAKTWSSCHLRHALVVIGLAHFKGDGGPKDGGWGLWALNSWGERWQEASQDGWVRAEPLLGRMQGDFEWIEADGRAPLAGSTVFPSYAKERALAHMGASPARRDRAQGAAPSKDAKAP